MFRRLLSSSFRSVAKSVSPSQGVRGNGLLKQRSARFYQAEAPKRTPEEIAKRTNRTFLVVFGGGSLLSLGYVGAVAANITQAPGVTEEEAEQMEPMERVSKIWKVYLVIHFESIPFSLRMILCSSLTKRSCCLTFKSSSLEVVPSPRTSMHPPLSCSIWMKQWSTLSGPARAATAQ
mmetsp:Transcript_47958/g.124514  ORF Transcript_47958/g.124514 Transcript_47958/m.124514 type:complete len:177 (+) Transcript_47958:1108-1638(+)